ncbi:hypothetical protein IMG5_163420 [Ichthyophthirius multifiliis]|uniref:Phosphodiesterase n=1 Tax=Ichthyophthirius multifiliis TaxID=5932 RepID=G0R0C4_ICHMU|nr:hypothetical protein IMG5_163420 [Ichthyophthirius multifiliis]EGR29086.1 hypothetical protein IMG5_163420 [Ichthyophthirius multifiliis]|eukprot:XP_004030322.1 hypothetical protein IMG5_163420 [Ichthyophthirius multifiliis]
MVIRNILRFIRLFFTFRKIADYKKKQQILKVTDKSPVEKIIQIFNNLLNSIQNEKYNQKLKWAIEIVTTHKLYEPQLEENQKEVYKQIYIKKYNIHIQILYIYIYIQNKIKQNNNIQFLIKKIKQLMEQFQINIKKESKTIYALQKPEQQKNITYLFIYLFNINNIYAYMKVTPQQIFEFANQVISQYLDNPYHNKIHCFDVTQTIHFFITRCEFISLADLNPLEIGTMYISSAIHDLQHPGFTNLYQINTRSNLAILYNDQSPLENHHLSTAFKLLFNKNENNIFSQLSISQYKDTRQIIISMILSTDMTYHFQDFNKLKVRLASNEFNCRTKDKQLCMNSLLHAADISNPFKPFHIYQQWTVKVLEEFWRQVIFKYIQSNILFFYICKGDKERELGLPISYLCDRFTTNMAKSQVGFIDFIVKPYYELISQFLIELNHYLPILDQNKVQWQAYEDYYTKQLENQMKRKSSNQEKKISF